MTPLHGRLPCTACGGPKPAGRARRLCDECQERQAQERPTVVYERRKTPCRSCGGTANKRRHKQYCDDCLPKHKREQSAGYRAVKPCRLCGGEKPRGKAYRYCDDCRELREWRERTRRTATRQRKPCRACNRSKPAGNGPSPYCAACRAKRMSRLRPCTRCGLKPARGKHMMLCVDCHAVSVEQRRARNREYARRVRRDPERRERLLRLNRESAARQDRERINELARLNYRLKRDRQGYTLRLAPERPMRRGESLPARQLAEAIERRRERDRGDLNETNEDPQTLQRAGVHIRRLYDWRAGTCNVTAVKAEDVMERLGLVWWDVWTPENTEPDDLARVARVFEGEAVAA